jgi:hypothetical protein
MDATADYAAAKALLAKPLPAYVSYTARSRAKFDAIVHDDTSDIVVRTKDGVVVKGKKGPTAPYVQVGDEQSGGDDEMITKPAFAPHCYVATTAGPQAYDGREVEAIALHDTCSKSKDDKDFDTLFVDPATHQPIAAVGTDNDDHVAVRLVQGYTTVHDYIVPSSLYVRVQGSGLMGWLDVLFDQRYENIRFSATEP